MFETSQCAGTLVNHLPAYLYITLAGLVHMCGFRLVQLLGKWQPFVVMVGLVKSCVKNCHCLVVHRWCYLFLVLHIRQNGCLFLQAITLFN